MIRWAAAPIQSRPLPDISFWAADRWSRYVVGKIGEVFGGFLLERMREHSFLCAILPPVCAGEVYDRA